MNKMLEKILDIISYVVVGCLICTILIATILTAIYDPKTFFIVIGILLGFFTIIGSIVRIVNKNI